MVVLVVYVVSIGVDVVVVIGLFYYAFDEWMFFLYFVVVVEVCVSIVIGLICLM